MTHPTILNRFCRFAAVPLCLAALAITRAAADVPTPTQVATCLSCHGNGMERPPTPTIPIIAGQQYDYLLAALTAYRNGDRRGGQAADMQTFAKQLKPSTCPSPPGSSPI